MNKTHYQLLIGILGLMLPLFAQAQLSVNFSRNLNITPQLSDSTYVLLNGSQDFNKALRQAIEKHWTFTPVKFVTEAELAQIAPEEPYLCIQHENRYRKPVVYHGIAFAVCKGKNARIFRYLGFGWLYCDQGLEHTSGSYYWRFPAFLHGIQRQLAETVDSAGNVSNFRNTAASIPLGRQMLSESLPQLRQDTLLVPLCALGTRRRDIISEDSLRAAWPYPLRFVSVSELREMAQNPNPNPRHWYLWVNRSSTAQLYIAPLKGGPLAFMAFHTSRKADILRIIRNAAQGRCEASPYWIDR